MAASYRKIDYRVRPAKSIERKMLAEVLRKLAEFVPLEDYRYVGFGSLYFSDFKLFHRMLGYKKMVSIENTQDAVQQKRFDFNSPYRHVQMCYGLSTNILAGLTWQEPTVLWLDYDGSLDRTVLNDIETAILRAVPGSALFVSVNAGPPTQKNEDGTLVSFVDALSRQIGAEMVPASVKSSDFSGWNTAQIYRTIINNKIEETLLSLSRVNASPKVYKQLVNFHYKDGVQMLTIGGVICGAEQDETYDRCGFDKLPFVSVDHTAYLIDPPLLTFNEIRSIDSMIPLSGGDYDTIPLSKADIDKYVKVYRYFPSFVEAEV
jgi:hypothetical protein